jgi:uncharacterized delta-60 repeat protein
VSRFTASGTLDKTFNGTGNTLFLPAGISNAVGGGVALQSNGKIVVAGFGTGTDGADDLLVARFNTNGTLDTSFGGGSGYVRLDEGAVASSSERGREVAIQPDGKIVVVGVTYVDGNGNPSRVIVARFNVDGTPDSAFAPGGYKIGAPLPDTGFHSFDTVGVALQSDGSIIVAGSDDQDATNNYVGHPFLMRFYGDTPALRAASAPTGVAATQILETGTAESLVNTARAYWQARGTDTSRLGHIDIAIADLGGDRLGEASGSTITLDDNAAGWGWNFGRAAGQGRKAVRGRMDLFSAVVHEVGHLLDHDHAEGGVMAATLASGVRQAAPSPGLVDVPKSGGDHPRGVVLAFHQVFTGPRPEAAGHRPGLIRGHD